MHEHPITHALALGFSHAFVGLCVVVAALAGIGAWIEHRSVWNRGEPMSLDDAIPLIEEATP